VIKRSKQFDLGLDMTRMKGRSDGQRQSATVDEILDRFFNQKEGRRRDIQILADEVGMGKTFVGLGVAYSVLEHMSNKRTELELNNCYQKVLIITPQNSALFTKWQREVSEFVKRCVLPEQREEAMKWFAPTPVERVDELSAKLRRTGLGPKVVVANMSIFSGGKLRNYDVKRRFLLGLLFRYWGPSLFVKQRERLLKGAPNGWPADPYHLTDLNDKEWHQIPFYEKEIISAFKRVERKDDPDSGIMERTLEMCKMLSEPYARDRETRFQEIERLLGRLYRRVTSELIRKNFPIVIVDEAHNWKNHRSGYENFVKLIAPKTRRLLLLTATPFQIHPEEMLRILEVSDHLRPCPLLEESAERVEMMRRQRDEVIRPVLKKAAKASRRFTEAWARLPRKTRSETLAKIWESEAVLLTKKELKKVASLEGVADEKDIQPFIDQALVGVDPDIRQFLREALKLYTYNTDLSYEMGVLVIRHRRGAEHRFFKVGSEYPQKITEINIRPDSHILHLSPGIDVKGDGELPHYILMRCVSEMKQFKGRSSLSSSLTGCYSTLLESQEGKQISKLLKNGSLGQVYLDLLMGMVSEDHDPYHPKMREVVDSVIEGWEAGEKSLIFCFRVNTAKRLKEIIDNEIRDKLAARRQRCLGGEEKIKFLRSRLTSREQDLVTIGLDRVIWSFILQRCHTDGVFKDFDIKDLSMKKRDLSELARLSLSFDVDLMGKRVDRVFINRSVEHIVAKRLLKNRGLDNFWRDMFSQMSDIKWITNPYGLTPKEEQDDEGEDIADFDERGVHTTYKLVSDPAEKDTKMLSENLFQRINRALKQKQIPIISTYHKGPSLWFGANPVDAAQKVRKQPKAGSGYHTIGKIHEQLHNLTMTEDGFDWESRRKLFQAMRKSLLRESMLLRLLPESTKLQDSGWAKLIVKSFFTKLPGQNESIADRINIFIEDLLAASGTLSDPSSARHFLYSASRLTDQKFVALITGKSKSEERERVFAGFNTPLLPEVLICTAVGQEGIDLHRHCRHVIHYDLAWNPAVLEQRTGRADRIGSKTFRERALAKSEILPFLEIGVPFLAGTYDERMYEELRLRAQTFEVLTGGDLATDSLESYDNNNSAELSEKTLDFVPLPEKMVSDLRVKLHVWSEKAA